MVIFDYRLPSPGLQEFVRLYQIIAFEFKEANNIFWKPYWPRPENCLSFYPRYSELIKFEDGRQEERKNRSALWGQFCQVTSRGLTANFFIFQIVFQPGALFRLTGIPSNLLTNTYIDGEAIFSSSEISRVNEQLDSASNSQEMIEMIEAYLRYLVSRVKYDLRPIDKASLYLLHHPKNISLDWLAREACLSRKQFYRKFVERIGVSPKLYARIIQLDHAVKLKNTQPHKDWLSIALELGYYDYQHLARDFKEFTGSTPSAFYLQEVQAPERQFGKSEM